MKKYILLVILSLFAVSCADVEYDYPEKTGRQTYGRGSDKEKKKLFGSKGISIGGDDEEASKEVSSIGVNSFLWRATLDTVSFMPITSADPFGGVVITDWYAMPETPDVMFKINVFILSGALRSDGVKVAAFKKEKKDGEWTDVNVDKSTVVKIEDAILTRARELKYATVKKR